MIIVGTGHLARELGRFLVEHRKQGFEVVGFIDEDPAKIGEPVVNPKVIGTPDLIPYLVVRHKVKKVIVAMTERRGKLPMGALLPVRVSGVEVLDGFTFYEGVTGKVLVEELKPGYLIFSKGFDRRKVTQLLKGTLDVTCATLGLILSAPLFLLIPILIKLDSPGPAFYRQERIGQGGKPFTLLKFRSMVANSETDSCPIWAQEDDPRITRVGQWLRKLRIDEIPQMVNVLKGEMSFIGPRPMCPKVAVDLEKQFPYSSLRHTVKPGITGWAQVKYHYAASMEEQVERVRYDLYYIKNMSLTLDLLILFKTVRVVLFGRGAR